MVQYFKHYRPLIAPAYVTPPGSWTLEAWADAFTTLSGVLQSGAPEVAWVNQEGQPSDSVGIGGVFSDAATFKTYHGSGSALAASGLWIADNRASVYLNPLIPSNAMTLLYVIDGGKYSIPAVINRADAWWLAGSTTGSTSVLVGDTVYANGQNVSFALDHDPNDGYDISSPATKCMVWLYNSLLGAGQYATVTSVNPYRVGFTMPAIWATTTSSTSVSLATGSRTFTVDTGLSYVSGLTLTMSCSRGFMSGSVTSYNSGTGELVVNVTSVESFVSGSSSSWTIEPTYSVSVYLHNGHGGIYGWSSALTLSVSNRPALGIKYDRQTVNADAQNGTDDTSAITTAIAAVGSAGDISCSGTVQLGEGIYRLSDRIVQTGGGSKGILLKGHANGTTITLAEKMNSSTSTDSVTIGTGTKNFTVATGLLWTAGQKIRVYRTANPANYMEGTVSSYDSGTGALAVSVGVTSGSGTYNAWIVGPYLTAGELISSSANSELRDLTIDNDQSRTYCEASIAVKRIVDCDITARWANGVDTYSRLKFGPTASCYMSGVDFTGPYAEILDATSVWIDNCNFYGTNLGNQLVNLWGGRNLTFTNNTAQHLDPNGTDATKVHGRIMVWANTNYGSGRNAYIAHNLTPTRLDNPQIGFGDGEKYLLGDGGLAPLSSMVTSSTSTVTTLVGTPDATWGSTLQMEAAIVGGRGEGQVRPIASVNVGAKTITLSQPWDLVPDDTSRINVIGTMRRIVLYDVTATGSKLDGDSFLMVGVDYDNSMGFQLFAGGNQVIVDDCTFTDMIFGYSEWAISSISELTQICPLFLNEVKNSTWNHSRIAVRTVIDADFDATATLLGVLRKRLTFTDVEHQEWYNHSNFNPDYMGADSFQDCSFSGAKYGCYQNGSAQVTNTVLYNTTFVGSNESGSLAKFQISGMAELGTTSFTNFEG